MPSEKSTAPIQRKRFATWQLISAPIIVLALTLPGLTQGDFRTDSHVYTSLATQMLQTGEWVNLNLGDVPYANKPPLAFWAAAPAIALLGPTLLAIRITALVWAILACLGSFALIKQLSNRRVAATACIVLALTYEFFRYTKAFTLDLPLTACMIWGTWALIKALHAKPNMWHRWALTASISLGAGLMVKPGVALIAPLIVSIWWTWERSLNSSNSTTNPAQSAYRITTSVVGALIVALPWHIAALSASDGAAETYLVDQSIGRGLGTTFDRDPWWKYAQELSKTYWPWLGLLVLGFPAWRNAATSKHARGAAARLAIVSLAIWLIALSLFADKRARYLVPAYPMLSVLVAETLIAWTRPNSRKLGRDAMLALPAIILALGIIGFILSSANIIHMHKPPQGSRPKLIELLLEANALTKNAPTKQGFGAYKQGQQDLWISPNGERAASYIYLDTGVFPRSLVGNPKDAAATNNDFPQVGDIILLQLHKAKPRWRSIAETQSLGTYSEMQPVKLLAQWQGLELIGPADTER